MQFTGAVYDENAMTAIGVLRVFVQSNPIGYMK
jgi:hypothetical protein